MKKSLLSLAVALVAVPTFAQGEFNGKDKVLGEINIRQPFAKERQAVVLPSSTMRGPARSKSTGLYYAKPEGCMYKNTYTDADGTEGSGYYVYYNTEIAVEPFEAFTYKNLSSPSTGCTWTYGGSDISIYQEEDGSMMDYVYPDWIGYVPVLSRNNDSYSMGHYGTDYTHFVYCLTDFAWLGFLDDKEDSAYGALESDNMWGSGDFIFNDAVSFMADAVDLETGDTVEISGTFPCSAIVQDYPRPASPLYVDGAYVVGARNGSEALGNGAELYLNIYDLETDELLETLTARQGDFTEWMSGRRNNKTVMMGCMKFTKTAMDPLFGETEVPIVIDRAIRVELTGFENQDVDFGPIACNISDCDVEEDLGNGKMGFIDPSGKYDIITSISYVDPLGLNVLFNSFMDKVKVADELYFTDGTMLDGYHALRLSEDGQTCSSEGKDPDHDIGALYVQTASPWFNETGAENYYVADLPEWITEVNVDTQYYDPEQYDYANYVSFKAEALPSGTSGRSAVVCFKGRGCTDTMPVELLQGDATMGISGLESDHAGVTGKVYNLNGQRVSGDAKGMVIKDGRKYLNK